jgi:cytochrome c oxidase subunit II
MQASNFISSVDGVFLFILIVSVVMLVLITFLMIYFVFRYNRKKHPVPTNIEGNTKLEIVWTVIPTILVLIMFYYGWVGYEDMRNAPANSFVMKVTARMWKWSFEYPNGLQTDTLYVPKGRPIKAELRSLDVNHAFFIPAFRVKKDVIPNRKNWLWFQSDKTGSYDVFCSSYCGLQHSAMYTKVVIMPQDEFDLWYASHAIKSPVKDATVASPQTAKR